MLALSLSCPQSSPLALFHPCWLLCILSGSCCNRHWCSFAVGPMQLFCTCSRWHLFVVAPTWSFCARSHLSMLVSTRLLSFTLEWSHPHLFILTGIGWGVLREEVIM